MSNFNTMCYKLCDQRPKKFCSWRYLCWACSSVTESRLYIATSRICKNLLFFLQERSRSCVNTMGVGEDSPTVPTARSILTCIRPTSRTCVDSTDVTKVTRTRHRCESTRKFIRNPTNQRTAGGGDCDARSTTPKSANSDDEATPSDDDRDSFARAVDADDDGSNSCCWGDRDMPGHSLGGASRRSIAPEHGKHSRDGGSSPGLLTIKRRDVPTESETCRHTDARRRSADGASHSTDGASKSPEIFEKE